MKINKWLIVPVFFLALLIYGYKTFISNYEIKSKKEVLSIQTETTLISTPTSTPEVTSTPTKKPQVKIVSTTTPQATNTINPTIPPTYQQNNIQSPTTSTSDGGYDEWSANQPKDSKGVLCINTDSRCKYECSVSDYWVDDHLRILNNHIQEYNLRLSIYEPNSSNVKIWEDAVVQVYNMIYDECKNSPKYSPQNPI